MIDPHDTYGNRRDQEVPPPPRRGLLSYVLGRTTKARTAGQAQPGKSVERVLYVHPTEAYYVRLYLVARGVAGVRVIDSAIVGAGAVQAANPVDVTLAADIMRVLDKLRAGGMLR